MEITQLKRLPHAWKRGTDFLGTRYAIMCGAMTWVSEANLVSAISNEGGFGVLAGGNMPPEILAKEIAKTREKTRNPFGVNLITVAPAFKQHIEVVIREKCPYVFFAGSIPAGRDIAEVKAAGLKIICFAPVLSLAKRLIKQGVDALVIEGNEAGGHIGPVATSILAQEFLLNVTEVPVFVAGGIGTGEIIAQYVALGAAGVQLGTRFVAAEECVAHPRFKEAFVRASARDAMPTTQFDPSLPTIPVRAIVNEGTKDFNRLQFDLLGKVKSGEMPREEAQVKLEEFWIGALRRAVVEGDVEHGSLMAGQSVAFVKKVQPVREILEELVAGAEAALARMAGEG
ncbi:MAG: 2-nitropropane dioxygenase [Deltaproteobacteria bacterium RBG_16_66_15]|nr:MAG: 2-nitropropane dioxygenase [Deltaproteobacteria bacterium GWA2_65_63]OGP28911.1 MAG: 2-nitropropane dioxygenase [Deltaproteobacteria bacterium GWB2_65_81]OGP40947.1 MAG: 2-nitropropane dioxygenase [Deltaproteobacteria bacterium GWC2_66_88]OGP78917.1 MAG: 2-nitropropane dioxygenase [Deltaproteobacteria bacterium RBG_16_66_15]HAM32176.1 2-nitropropane dioxygenase [Deltaproteobacteria bacterium]